MNVHFHSEPAAFEEAAGDFLMDREAENNLMIGLIASVAAGNYAEYRFATVEEDDRVVACALQTPPFRMLLTPARQAAIDHLCAALHDQVPDLPGVIGPLGTVEGFARTWNRLTGTSSRVSMSQGIYRLHSVIPPASPPTGFMRVIMPDDVDLAVAWMRGFLADTGIDDQRPQRESIERRLRNQSLFFWEADGRCVSMAAKAGSTPNGIRIGFVYTPPEFRDRGYASVLVAQLSQRMLDEGKTFCVLYTDLENPTSNKIYQRMGYEHLFDGAMITFEYPEQGPEP